MGEIIPAHNFILANGDYGRECHLLFAYFHVFLQNRNNQVIKATVIVFGYSFQPLFKFLWESDVGSYFVIGYCHKIASFGEMITRWEGDVKVVRTSR